jgi:hypothetical protein
VANTAMTASARVAKKPERVDHCLHFHFPSAEAENDLSQESSLMDKSDSIVF